MSCGTETKPHNLGFEYIEHVGQKVRLRPTTSDDAAQGFKLLYNNQDILKWLIWDGPKSRHELAETYGIRWPQEMRAGTKYSLAIEEKTNPGVIIGCIDARILLYPQQMEPGYWLGSPYWRKGYAQEALALVCYFCFKHLNAAAMLSSAFVGNSVSRRVQEKNGFQYEGTLRSQIFKNGKWIDLWHLSLLREEWEKRGFEPVSERLVPAFPSTAKPAS
jgi:ribosomal-protein-alanine N-acetyltransferase